MIWLKRVKFVLVIVVVASVCGCGGGGFVIGHGNVLVVDSCVGGAPNAAAAAATAAAAAAGGRWRTSRKIGNLYDLGGNLQMCFMIRITWKVRSTDLAVFGL